MRVDTEPDEAGADQYNEDIDKVEVVSKLVSDCDDCDQVASIDEDDDDLGPTPDQPDDQKSIFSLGDHL